MNINQLVRNKIFDCFYYDDVFMKVVLFSGTARWEIDVDGNLKYRFEKYKKGHTETYSLFKFKKMLRNNLKPDLTRFSI